MCTHSIVSRHVDTVDCTCIYIYIDVLGFFQSFAETKFNLLPSTKHAHHAHGSKPITVPDLFSPLEAGMLGACLGQLV